MSTLVLYISRVETLFQLFICPAEMYCGIFGFVSGLNCESYERVYLQLFML